MGISSSSRACHRVGRKESPDVCPHRFRSLPATKMGPTRSYSSPFRGRPGRTRRYVIRLWPAARNADRESASWRWIDPLRTVRDNFCRVGRDASESRSAVRIGPPLNDDRSEFSRSPGLTWAGCVRERSARQLFRRWLFTTERSRSEIVKFSKTGRIGGKWKNFQNGRQSLAK
jgi:hypothetical protein